MKTNTKATNIILTSELRDYIDKKLAGVEKFLDPNDTSIMCDVEVARTTAHHKAGEIFRAEFHIHIAGKYLTAVSEKDNINAALDEVKDEIIHSLKSYKTKKDTLFKRGSAKIKNILKGLPWN
ncbi:MAG: ribosome-associated translation inhibitor RaiA [Patescibacteria group bacterium]